MIIEQHDDAYDALNRCIKRTLNGTATYLCYAGWNLIEEHASNGTLNVTYVHGANTDEILMKTDANGTVYYHQDALGNVTHLTNATGTLIEQYRYDAFGSPTFLDAQNNILANSAYGNRFLFTGREWLHEIQLYDYRNRIYSANLSKFLQPDPIRFGAGDVNFYRYVANNPVNLIDPDGKNPIAAAAGIVAASAAMGASAATVSQMAQDLGRGQMSSIQDYQRAAAAGAVGGIAGMWGGPIGSMLGGAFAEGLADGLMQRQCP